MNAPLPPDPYRALGVESSADAGVIKTAYRKLVLKCHPDKFPDLTLKAQKQEEFQRVQQAYEILADEDRRRDYDLEVKAKKLREELARRGVTASTNSPAHGRSVNVNIRTAEPPPGWSSSKYSTSKSSPTPYKPYSKEYSQSWEHEIPSRSKVYHDEERRARRTASYEKPKREDSRERRRRMEEDREREKRREREREEESRSIRRQQKLAREREAVRERDRERKERKAREEREAAKAKEAKKMREKERERERDSRRKQELDDKARAKSKPYLEHSGYSEEDDDVRRSRAKKSSSPKKQSDSPSREKPTTKQRDRSNPGDNVPGEEYREKIAFAASYMEKIRSKASKTSPRHNAEVPTYSAAYPDPNEKWAPKRRASGDGKHAKDESVIVDAPEPDKAHPEVVSTSSNTQQAPPRLQKSHTMPSGYIPQTQTAASVPPRVPLNRAFTMQPEHEYSRPAEKHRSARRRMSFDEDDNNDYYKDYTVPVQTTHYISSRDRGVPRIIDTKYKDPYAAAPGVTFSKVKTAPAYGVEHVATSRRYDEDDVMTADYSHMQPSYDYRTAAVR